MKHLLNDSVYAPVGKEVPLPAGCDGIELLTGYSPVEARFFSDSVSVHLPYTTDWYSVWTGRYTVPDSISDENVRYLCYGRDRESIIESVRSGIEYAAPLKPAYGVIHAGSANINELLSKRYSYSDHDVLSAFAEIINTAISSFPGGEPPFKLVFENQWWPGLRMLDAGNYRTLCDKIEFENWGLCLDTGHLLVTTQQSESEEQAIDLLLKIFDTYPEDMVEDITTMHLHVNTSADVIRAYIPPVGYDDLDLMDRYSVAYKYVCSIDQHRPFSDKNAKRLVEYISPDFVTHEIGESDMGKKLSAFGQQRSLFIES